MISADTLPRLLATAGARPASLDQHESFFGPRHHHDVASALRDSGLLGRGGAGFPTSRKVELLASQRGHDKLVAVNAMEGEPAAHKDANLLATNPHLVLEGAEVLASLIGASAISVCVARDNGSTVNHVIKAVHERTRASLRGPDITVLTPPGRYVAGEESALVHWLGDNQSLPQFRPERPSILRVRRKPVLVENAETCANVALIARYGAQWFRSLGTQEHPGSMLVSVTGAVARPVVLEAALGASLRDLLKVAGADEHPAAILVGGYGGTWLGPEVLDVPYANESLRALGASVGAGIVCVIPRDACGLVEVQRVVRWMANESARQCGPCAFGLPALASDLQQLVAGGAEAHDAVARLEQRCGTIEGRGACRHPDGVVRFVRTALAVFGEDVAAHARRQPCRFSRATRHFLTVPALEREESLQWD